MDTVLYDFVALFVVLDPIGTAAIFAGMTRSVAEAQRRNMALRATVMAGLILFAFALGGEALLGALGIGLPAFRIAGGLMLFLLAIDMVFARQSGLRSMTPVEDRETEEREDITVFPLAFPLIAGPGAMTTLILLMGRADGDLVAMLPVVAVLTFVLALTYFLLLGSRRVLHLLGMTGSNVVSRVLGILLAALAVQFVLDGVHQSFPNL